MHPLDICPTVRFYAIIAMVPLLAVMHVDGASSVHRNGAVTSCHVLRPY